MLRQRTHRSRSNSVPAACAEHGSKAFWASTHAHTSSRVVMAARIASVNAVRLEEAGPTISVNPPRGKPPVRASISSRPDETTSDTQFSRKVKGEGKPGPKADSTWARSTADFMMREPPGELRGNA